MPISWYGKGKTRIDPRAFEQIEKDSDRAAGMVAGAIVERRLEEAIKFCLVADDDLHKQMFRPSGPFGAFSVKIDMAYLMGIVSPDASADLSIIKDIRNDFAHRLELDTFQVPSIRDRCGNLRMIDAFHKDWISGGEIGGSSVWFDDGSLVLAMGVFETPEVMKEPRARFIATAKMLSFVLGKAVWEKRTDRPYL